MSILVRFAIVSLSLGALCPCILLAQEPAPPIRVLYTGRLMGYYYALDNQKDGFSHCPDPTDLGNFSQATKSFIDSRSSDSILVGTGNTFAAYLKNLNAALHGSQRG